MPRLRSHAVAFALLGFLQGACAEPPAIPVVALAFSPDGSALVSNASRRIDVRSPTDGRLQRSIVCDIPRIASLSFSADGNRLAAGGGEPGTSGLAVVMDWPSGNIVCRVDRFSDMVNKVAWGGSGKTIGTASVNSQVALWNIAKPNPTDPDASLTGHVGSVLTLAFAPTGPLLVTAGSDRSLKIWTSDTRTLLRTLHHHTESIHALAFRPATETPNSTPSAQSQGNHLVCATGGDDRTVRIWQPEIGRMVRIVRGHKGPILALAWHPDGTRLYSAGTEGVVREIEGDSDEILSSDPVSKDWIYSLVIDAKGIRLASGDASGVVRIKGVASKPR